jgi:hypothetical protein
MKIMKNKARSKINTKEISNHNENNNIYLFIIIFGILNTINK